jgi:hypothetical protein
MDAKEGKARNRYATVCGYVSLGCSLSFWVLGPQSSVGVLPKTNFPFETWESIWLTVWATAFILGLIAAIRVSKLWTIAAVLPLMNVLVALYVTAA